MLSETGRDASTWRVRVKWAFLAFAFIGAFLLLAEHRAHIFPWLPWLFLAACLFMHFFMHHGHGKHDHRGDPRSPSVTPDSNAAAPPVKAPTTAVTSAHRHGERS